MVVDLENVCKGFDYHGFYSKSPILGDRWLIYSLFLSISCRCGSHIFCRRMRSRFCNHQVYFIILWAPSQYKDPPFRSRNKYKTAKQCCIFIGNISMLIWRHLYIEKASWFPQGGLFVNYQLIFTWNYFAGLAWGYNKNTVMDNVINHLHKTVPRRINFFGCFTIKVHSCILKCYKCFPKREKVLIQ